MTTGRLLQINVNPEGGVPKRPVPSARLTRGGVEGDRQRNLKLHGGPDRAVCLLGVEVIHRLGAEGHPIAPGTTGENLTIEGLPWAELSPGDRLRVGSALLELASFTTPCKNIADSFIVGAFVRLSHKLHPGESRLYARVLEEGLVQAGDEVAWLPLQLRF